MSKRPEVVFLQRNLYRQNRLLDWIRVVPVIGLFLWLLPILWGREGADATRSSSAIVYVFLVWIALIFITFISARLLKKTPQYLKDFPDQEDG